MLLVCLKLTINALWRHEVEAAYFIGAKFLFAKARGLAKIGQADVPVVRNIFVLLTLAFDIVVIYLNIRRVLRSDRVFSPEVFNHKDVERLYVEMGDAFDM